MLFIVDIETEKLEVNKRKEYSEKLKVINSNNIKFITVNKENRKSGDKMRIYVLKEYSI